MKKKRDEESLFFLCMVLYFTASFRLFPALNAGVFPPGMNISSPSSRNPPPYYVAIAGLVKPLTEPYVQLSKHTAPHPNNLA